MMEELLKNKLDEIRQELDLIIKNNHEDLNYISLCTHQYNAMRNVLEELLEEIQNTDDKYKNAWEELKKISQNDDCGEKTAHDFLWFLEQTMQELEKKHGIGVE